MPQSPWSWISGCKSIMIELVLGIWRHPQMVKKVIGRQNYYFLAPQILTQPNLQHNQDRLRWCLQYWFSTYWLVLCLKQICYLPHQLVDWPIWGLRCQVYPLPVQWTCVSYLVDQCLELLVNSINLTCQWILLNLYCQGTIGWLSFTCCTPRLPYLSPRVTIGLITLKNLLRNRLL